MLASCGPLPKDREQTKNTVITHHTVLGMDSMKSLLLTLQLSAESMYQPWGCSKHANLY